MPPPPIARPPVKFGSLASHYDGRVVAVTGGLGFIGSNLVRRLAEESTADIRVIDSLDSSCGGRRENIEGIARRVEVHTVDLNEAESLDSLLRDASVVFNLAGKVSHLDSMAAPILDLRANGEAHLKLLEACRRSNRRARLVYTSTRQVYGRPLSLPVNEEHPIAPVDVNGINKFCAESFHRLYHRTYGIESCILRLTNTYGPGMVTSHARLGFIGWFFGKILAGEEIVLFGDGSQIRDLNHIDCVVDALLLAGIHTAARGKTYNLGSGEPITLLELTRMMIEIAGRGSLRIQPFPEERRAIDIGSYYSDFSLIRRELGWAPRVSLREGVSRTFARLEQGPVVARASAS